MQCEAANDDGVSTRLKDEEITQRPGEPHPYNKGKDENSYSSTQVATARIREKLLESGLLANAATGKLSEICSVVTTYSRPPPSLVPRAINANTRSS